jgi:hypothetical protein
MRLSQMASFLASPLHPRQVSSKRYGMLPGLYVGVHNIFISCSLFEGSSNTLVPTPQPTGSLLRLLGLHRKLCR